jgi:hypothetical protein
MARRHRRGRAARFSRPGTDRRGDAAYVSRVERAGYSAA